MVGLFALDLEGAINLLQQQHAHQLVGERKGSERNHAVSAGKQRFVKTQRAADDEGKDALSALSEHLFQMRSKRR